MTDRKTPPPKRQPTHGDRNEGRRAVVTPPQGTALPAFVEEEITDQYEGEQLALMRRTKRTTLERVGRLEVKHDELKGVVDRMDGKLGGLHDFAARAEAAREAQELRDTEKRERRDAARGKWIIALVTTLGIAVAGIIAAAVH